MLRLLGTLFILAAAATLVYDIWEYIGTREASLVTSYQLWSMFGSASLEGFRGLIEQNVSASFWADILRPVLNLPAVVLLGAIALLLMLAGRRRG
jgi:hypothetical protein